MKAIIFTSVWCSPCKAYKPEVLKAREAGAQIDIIDVDEEHDIAELFGIRSIPTTVIQTDAGEVASVHHNAMKSTELLELLKG